MTLAQSSTKKESFNKNFLIFALLLAAIGAYIPPGSSDIALPILLKEKNYSDTFIGIVLGLYLISYASACLLLPSCFKKFARSQILYFTIANTLLSLLTFAFSNHPILFMSCYIVQGGLTAITIIILTDAITTLSHKTTNKNILMGFFVNMTSAGYFLGIALTGRSYVASVGDFLIISCIFVICFLPLCCSKSFHYLIEPKIHEELPPSINVYNPIKAFKIIPIGLITIIIFGINDNVVLGLTPIWGISHGMNTKEAAFLTIPILIGGVILTPFLSLPFKFFGYLKTALLYLLILITLFTIIHFCNLYDPKLALLFPSASLFVKMFDHPLIIIIGGLINAFEALYLCVIADQFKGTALIEACAIATFLSHVAGAMACAISGYIIADGSYHQFGTFLITINAVLMIALLKQYFSKKNSPNNSTLTRRYEI
ncbi:MAG: MFS transporter [Verrucomicrobia bacterium]|nr:MFS transporter [Verrucomicrobiota bacterium]